MKLTVNLKLAIFLTLLLTLMSHDICAEQLLSLFPNGEKPGGAVFFLSLFLALIAALGIHELGHLLTGLAQGFRFELFVVFLLGIRRTDKGIRIFLNRNLGYMGGVAATVPTTIDPRNRKRFAWMVLAGPVASLLFAAICFLFLLFSQNILWTFWLIAGTASLSLFFATTIPSKSGIYFTDRTRFQRLISKGHEGQSEEALLKIIARTTIDNSCKNISVEDARILQTDKEAFMHFWGYYYEYYFFKANDNTSKAAESKTKLLNLKGTISGPVWKALKIEEEPLQVNS